MASLGPKKDGSPNTEYFNSAESLQGFESVRQWLQKNSKKVSPSICDAAGVHQSVVVSILFAPNPFCRLSHPTCST